MKVRKSIAFALLTTGLGLQAQDLGNSPYASFGIGDIKYENTIENSGMAGLSTAFVSDFNSSFNFKNPAANSNLELTSIKLEGTNENNYYKSGATGQKNTKHATFLSNLSIAFPIHKKVKFGIGYQPFSSKNYTILDREDAGNGITKINRFRGEGNLSSLHSAISYKISPSFTVGFKTNYVFGNLYDINEFTYSNAQLINGYRTKFNINTFDMVLGSVYEKSYPDDKKLTLGTTVNIGNVGKMNTTFTNSTYYYGTGDTKLNESIIEQKSSVSNNLIPREFSLGAGYGSYARWYFGSQFDYRSGEKIQYLGKDFEYKKSYRFTAGGWLLPNANDFRNYFNRVVYRYGAYYEKGNLEINNTNINEFGFTLGATFPFKNANINKMTGIDMALEFGKRGTTKNNLVRQNFINLKFGINFADKWFRKNLYD